jgi:alkylresorcinol/alkylpyrone synthase
MSCEADDTRDTVWTFQLYAKWFDTLTNPDPDIWRVARAADYLRAFPSHTALLVSVEVCSLTLQRKDKSVANVIASGLFADGAAAALLTGGARFDSSPSPRVVTSRSMFFPDTEEMMGWRLTDTEFQIVLSAVW